MQYAESSDKLYFTGLNCAPGYLSISSDNSTFDITYYDVLLRDSEAIVVNARRQNGGALYECIEAHTSSTTDAPGTGINWTRYWFKLDGPPGSAIAWATATAYTTTFIKRYDSNATVIADNSFPTTIELYAGRIWLSGDPAFPNQVIFSRVITRDTDIPKFHQYADPFDPLDPDLVADDGGVILLQGLGIVKRLIAVGTSLFIGTVSGIAQISGPDGLFTTTNFTNFTVLGDGISGADSMVKVDGEIVSFGQDAIWKSTTDTTSSTAAIQSGQATFKAISHDKVDTKYSNIPQKSKASAVAIYNPSERRVYYFHNATTTSFSTSYNSFDQPGYFTSVLVVDTDFEEIVALLQPEEAPKRRLARGAYFSYGFNDGAGDEQPYLAAPFLSRDVPPDDEPVTAGGVAVTATSLPVLASGQAQAKDVILIFTMQRVIVGANTTINAAFATMNTSNISDWESNATYTDTQDAYIYSGVQVMQNVMPNKAATYIYFVFKKVETGIFDGNNIDTNPGSCLVATAWDFAITEANPKHSSFKQVYFPDRYSYAIAGAGDDGFNHVWRKHRVRGRGNALQIIFKSEDAKDFHLVGWAQNFYGTE